MSHKKGTHLGGIRTVEDLRIRCRIDEDTACWHWSLGKVDGIARVHLMMPNGTPTIMRGPKASLYLKNMKDLPKGHIAYHKDSCEKDCVNPEHMRSSSKKAFGQHMTKTGALKNSAKLTAANRKIAREKLAKITEEQSKEIRQSSESATILSERYGIEKSNINAIRRGDAWKELLSGASVFTWRGTCSLK